MAPAKARLIEVIIPTALDPADQKSQKVKVCMVVSMHADWFEPCSVCWPCFTQVSQMQALPSFLLSHKQQVVYITGCSAVTKATGPIHNWLFCFHKSNRSNT